MLTTKQNDMKKRAAGLAAGLLKSLESDVMASKKSAMVTGLGSTPQATQLWGWCT